MTSSNGSIFRVTGPLCGEFTGPRWIPHTKASDAELWCFLICVRINGWVNNLEAGDLRRPLRHYDVRVMQSAALNVATKSLLAQQWLQLGLYSLNRRTLYRKILWSVEAARFDVIMIVSLWNLTDIFATLLPRYLSNFRAIEKVHTRIAGLPDFRRSCDKTSVRLTERGLVQ